MIVALAMSRAAWTAAFALLARHILAPLAAGKYFGLRRHDAAGVARKTAAADGDPTFSNGRGAVSAAADGDPLTSSVKSKISNPKSQIVPSPLPPSPIESPYNHDPNATTEQALRQADAIWQTLLNAFQQHLNDNLSTHKPEDNFHKLGIAPRNPSPVLDPRSHPAPCRESEIYLIAHNPRHLNTLTLILKRIQNSRISILQAINGDTDAPIPDTKNDPTLRKISAAIAAIYAHQSGFARRAPGATVPAQDIAAMKADPAITALNPGQAPAPAGLAPVERRTDKLPAAPTAPAPTGLAPVERRTDKLPAAPAALAPTGLAPVERRTDKLPAGPAAPAPAPTGLAPVERRTDKLPAAPAAPAPTGLAPVERRTDKLPAAPAAPAPTGLAPVERRTDKLPAAPSSHGEQATLNILLDIIRSQTGFIPDNNATLPAAIRQCDALWQCLQTAIAPLTPLATTVLDFNNLTTAHWRITSSRNHALTLLPPSSSSSSSS